MIELPRMDCNKCSLREGCSQVVWGIGKRDSKIMIVGDNPTSEEDLIGEPFVSREGALLYKFLEKTQINKEDVYFTYAVKCCPSSAQPTKENINTCRNWLWQEIQAVKPKVILSLGKISTGLLLNLKKSFKLELVVGRFWDVNYTNALISPWYSMSFILNRGKSFEDATLSFFEKIREKTGENL